MDQKGLKMAQKGIRAKSSALSFSVTFPIKGLRPMR